MTNGQAHGGNGAAPATANAPNIDQLVNELEPRFKQYIDYLHPENLAEKNGIVKQKVNAAYNSFMDYMKAKSGDKWWIVKQDATNKRENAKKTLDSFLLQLIKEFDPAFAGHLNEKHFEDADELSGYIRVFAQQLFGVNNEILQRAEASMAGGNDMLEGLEIIANYMRNKNEGYLAHLSDLEFTKNVGESLYHKAAFARYLRTRVPAFKEYFKDYGGPGEGLESRLAVNNQLREQVVQAVVHSAYSGDGAKEALARAMGMKKGQDYQQQAA